VPVPGRTSIYRALVRNGLVVPGQRKRRRADYRRWERARPMELWQMDVVGGFHLSDGTELKAVSGIDDSSRFAVTRHLLRGCRISMLRGLRLRAFNRYKIRCEPEPGQAGRLGELLAVPGRDQSADLGVGQHQHRHLERTCDGRPSVCLWRWIPFTLGERWTERGTHVRRDDACPAGPPGIAAAGGPHGHGGESRPRPRWFGSRTPGGRPGHGSLGRLRRGLGHAIPRCPSFRGCSSQVASPGRLAILDPTVHAQPPTEVNGRAPRLNAPLVEDIGRSDDDERSLR
jgi:hypothetical protein